MIHSGAEDGTSTSCTIKPPVRITDMKSWWLFGAFVLVFLIATGAHGLISHETAVQVAKAGPGAEVAPAAQLQELVAALFKGASGLGAIATLVINVLRNIIGSMPAGQSKDIALQVVDVAGINLYSGRFKKSVNAAERKALKDAAFALDQQNFSALFPPDPKVDGTVTA